MTISSVNTNKFPIISNPDTSYKPTEGAVAAEEKLAVIAFQKIYEMMLEGSDGTNSSGMLSTLLVSLQGEDGSVNGLDAENSLSALGSFNLGNRDYSSFSNISLSNQQQYGDNSTTDIGFLSAKYESNGNPGVIANNPGDPGGKSYGAWQFSSRMGSLNSFINWLEDKNTGYYNQLVEAKNLDGNTYGKNFDNTWSSMAARDGDSFLKTQYSYVKEAFYNSAAEELRKNNGFDINNKPEAMKNVLWSTVVQHGVSGAVSIFSKVNLKGSDEEIIKDIYGERQKVNIYFKSSSPSVKASVYNRFSKEQAQALNLLNSSEL